MEEKKKLAAAVAAVFTYIKTQEEAASMAQAQGPGIAEPAVVAPQVIDFPKPNLWGQSGRQNQMQLRSMMQLRMFK